MNFLHKFRRCACITTFSLLTVTGLANAESKSPEYLPNFVRTNAKYTYEVANPYTNFNKALTVLKHRDNGNLMDMSMYVGMFLQAQLSYTDSNVDGVSFGTLLRSSTSVNKQSASRVGDFFGVASFTATPASWVTAYMDMSVFDGDQGDLTVRNFDVILGDLSNSPLYFSVGRGSVPFGKFESLNGTRDSLIAAYFQPKVGNATLGLNSQGFDVTVSVARSLNIADALNGAQSDVSVYNGVGFTSEKNNIDTFIVRAGYMDTHANGDWYVGAGWNNNGPFNWGAVAGTETAQSKNSVWDVNAGFTWDDFSLIAEYVRQSDKWQNQNAVNAIIKAPYGYDVQAAYDFNFAEYDHRLSAGYGMVKFASGASSQKSRKAFNVDLVTSFTENFSAFINYEYTKGAKIPTVNQLMSAEVDTVSSIAYAFPLVTQTQTKTLKESAISLGVRAVF